MKKQFLGRKNELDTAVRIFLSREVRTGPNMDMLQKEGYMSGLEMNL